MDKEKHRDVLYVNGRGITQMKMNDPSFTKCTTIQDDMYEMEMTKSKIVLICQYRLAIIFTASQTAHVAIQI